MEGEKKATVAYSNKALQNPKTNKKISQEND